MKPKTIRLEDYVEAGVGVLAGQDAGRAVRDKCRLDDVDALALADAPDGVVTIVIPDFVYSFNSSYFLGMLAPSVNTLGAVEFRRRYVFVGPDADQIRERGIRVSLLTRRPLDGFSSRRPSS
jgi:hypothetical protein